MPGIGGDRNDEQLLIDVRLSLTAGAAALMRASAAARAGGPSRALVLDDFACRQEGGQQHQAADEDVCHGDSFLRPVRPVA